MRGPTKTECKEIAKNRRLKKIKKKPPMTGQLQLADNEIKPINRND